MLNTNHRTTLACFLLAAGILACGAGPIPGDSSAAGDDPAERPDLTVLHTINNVGYIEPCG